MRIINGLTCFVCGLAAISAQTITSVAGNSSWGQIYNVSLDAAGNLYAADYTKRLGPYREHRAEICPGVETADGAVLSIRIVEG